MRQIRFRAYINDGGYKRVSEIGEIKFTTSITEPYILFDEFGTLLEKETVEGVVEFTGLTDKNGKRIYEGDLVKDIYGHLLEVIFEGGCYKAVIYGCEVEGSELSGIWKNNIAVDFKIVGNIYENSKLLEAYEL